MQMFPFMRRAPNEGNEGLLAQRQLEAQLRMQRHRQGMELFANQELLRLSSAPLTAGSLQELSGCLVEAYNYLCELEVQSARKTGGARLAKVEFSSMGVFHAPREGKPQRASEEAQSGRVRSVEFELQGDILVQWEPRSDPQRYGFPRYFPFLHLRQLRLFQQDGAWQAQAQTSLRLADFSRLAQVFERRAVLLWARTLHRDALLDHLDRVLSAEPRFQALRAQEESLRQQLQSVLAEREMLEASHAEQIAEKFPLPTMGQLAVYEQALGLVASQGGAPRP